MMPWHFAFLRIALFLPFAPFCPALVFLSPQHRAHFATFSFHIFVSFFGLCPFQVLRRPLQCLSSRDRRSMTASMSTKQEKPKTQTHWPSC
jgi:hypothetical protein